MMSQKTTVHRVGLGLSVCSIVWIIGLWLHAHRQPALALSGDTQADAYMVNYYTSGPPIPGFDGVSLGPLAQVNGRSLAKEFDATVSDKASCGYDLGAKDGFGGGLVDCVIRLTGPSGITDLDMTPGFKYVAICKYDSSGKPRSLIGPLDCTEDGLSFERKRWLRALQAAVPARYYRNIL